LSETTEPALVFPHQQADLSPWLRPLDPALTPLFGARPAGPGG
jgi:hypothetical protein